MVYEVFKNLTRGTTSNKILRNKAFNIDIAADSLEWFINFLIKRL